MNGHAESRTAKAVCTFNCTTQPGSHPSSIIFLYFPQQKLHNGRRQPLEPEVRASEQAEDANDDQYPDVFGTALDAAANSQRDVVRLLPRPRPAAFFSCFLTDIDLPKKRGHTRV